MNRRVAFFIVLIAISLLGCTEGNPTSTCRGNRIVKHLQRQTLALREERLVPEEISRVLESALAEATSNDRSVPNDKIIVTRMLEIVQPLRSTHPLVKQFTDDLTSINQVCLNHCDVHRQLWEHP